jgi:hypothetical protein
MQSTMLETPRLLENRYVSVQDLVISSNVFVEIWGSHSSAYCEVIPCSYVGMSQGFEEHPA